MANVYFGDGYAELPFTATAGYNPTMVAGTATGNQTFTRSGGVPIPVSVTSGYPRLTIKITEIANPYIQYVLSPLSVTSTTVTISGFLSGSAGKSYTFQFLAFDWNNDVNWYSTLGTYSCCCGSSTYTPGAALGRVPNPSLGDTVVLVGSGVSVIGYGGNIFPSHIVNGPSSTYSGSITWGGPAGGWTILSVGSYSGAITVNAANSAPPAIIGGTYSGTITLTSTGWISGGSFTGTVNRAASAGVPVGKITGGTYSPTATIALGPGNTLNSGYPNDPGFLSGGGAFSPSVTITGVGGGGINGVTFPVTFK